ncbi:hypothetical protein ACLKA7_014673 [Drosophila subpalustris]
MENDDYQPLLRRRRKSYLKWTESKVLEFLEIVLDLVKDVPESLEKPTAQKFYTKFKDPIQFPLPPHNDGFNVFVLVQRLSKMRHNPGGLSSKIAIKSLN